ncbi:hypothetical protein E0L18_06815 [Pasteurella multocida subsp. multocida]|nr:hypothetical protein E0L18_06815 [Pasteurella multocida subsp. multocida]
MSESKGALLPKSNKILTGNLIKIIISLQLTPKISGQIFTSALILLSTTYKWDQHWLPQSRPY